MAKAISYRRFSSGKQAMGDSLRRQTEAAQAYCDAHGDELDLSFVDPGMSAYRGRNATEGALKRFVELAETGTFEPGTKLIVEHLDRLSRSELTTAQSQLVRILRAGIMVVTLADGQEYTHEKINSDLGSIIVSIVMMFKAHEESALKGKRVAKAKQARFARALAGDGVKMTRMGPEWLKASRGSGERFEFLVVEERAAIVRRVFSMCIAGLGNLAIAAMLNREGVPPFRSKDGWHPGSVAQILRSDRVLGIFRPTHIVNGRRVFTRELIAGYFPPIITESVFHQAQEAIIARRHPRSAGRKGRYSNLLSGLGRCTRCGSTLNHGTRASRRRPDGTGRLRAGFLMCSNAMRAMGCSNRYAHPYPSVESEVLAVLSTLPDVARLLEQPTGPDAEQAAALEGLIATKTATVDRLLDGFATEASPRATVRIKKLEAEIAEHEAELASLRRQERIFEATKGRDIHAEFRALVARLDADMDDSERFVLRSKLHRELLRIVDGMDADGDRMTIWFKASSGRRIGLRLVKGVASQLTARPLDARTIAILKDISFRSWLQREVFFPVPHADGGSTQIQ